MNPKELAEMLKKLPDECVVEFGVCMIKIYRHGKRVGVIRTPISLSGLVSDTPVLTPDK